VCTAARGAKQSVKKVDELTKSTTPATAAETTVQAEHRLNLARQIGKMATRIDRRFLAMSYPLDLGCEFTSRLLSSTSTIAI